jgi:transposase
MRKLNEIDRDQLKLALDEVTSAKAAKRLVVALAYKDGVDVDELSSRYGIPQSTIYYWLDRFEKRDVEGALEDEHRPGRPPKLTAEQHAEVESWLADSSEDSEEWTARRLQQRITEEFDVEYSVAHVRRRFLS